MDSSPSFTVDDTKKIQHEARELLSAMSPEFREHVMRSFMWTQENLDAYLSRDMVLEGDTLKNAYSHLESLLARIESFATDQPSQVFPSYEDWVKHEYQQYIASLSEDKKDIERLIGEGGVVAPGNTSPVDTMENDTLAHYHYLKSEFVNKQKDSQEAITLMQSSHFKSLKRQALLMCKVIMANIYK